MGDALDSTVGPYRLEQRLVGGSDADVFAAVDGVGRPLVVKIHLPAAESQGLAEASLLGLEHPGVAACRDAFRRASDGALVTVTARVQGLPLLPGSLAGLRDEVAAAVVGRLLSALGAVHALGLVHRDLKPDNVLLAPASQQPVLLDFGLACPADPAQQSALAGTPRAFAPELFAGASASVATDLWAAGLLLAEGFLGPLVSASPDLGALATERAELTLPEGQLELATGRADVAELLTRLLSADPARRPGSVAIALAGLHLLAPQLSHEFARHALEASRSAVFGRADPRRRSRLAALRSGAAWLDLCPESGASAASVLVEWAADRPADDGPAAGPRTPDDPSPEGVAALAATLAKERPLQLQVAVCDAVDPADKQARQRLVELLRRQAGVTVLDAAAPTSLQCRAVLSEWTPDAQPLIDRMGSMPVAGWRELDEALRELLRVGAVSASGTGCAWDETVLPAAWPLPDPGQLPPLPEGQQQLLDLLCVAPRPLSSEALQHLLGRQVSDELSTLAATARVRSEVYAGQALHAPADERLRRACLPLARVSDALRWQLAAELLPGEGEPGEWQAAAFARVLGSAPVQPGQDPEELAPAALSCVATLRRLDRLHLAEQLLLRTLAGCAPTAPVRAELQLERIDVLVRRGSYDAAAQALELACLERSHHDPALQLRRGRLAALRGRLAEALPLLSALDLTGLSPDDGLLALQTRAGVLHGLGKNREALVDLREALRRAGGGSQRRTMTLLERMGHVERELGEHERALRCFEQAIAMARELGQDALIWSPLYNIGRTIRDRGEKRRGLAIQEQAAQVCERAGNRAGLATVLNSLGAGLITLGRTDQARGHLTRALGLARELGNPATEAMVHNNLGSALAAEGRMDEAQAAWSESLALRERLSDARGQAAVRLTRGEWRLRHGDREGAADDLTRSQDLLQGLSSAVWQVSAELLGARLAAHDGHTQESIRQAQAAQDLATEHDLLPELCRARALLCRAGIDDLEDLEQLAGEVGPWTAEAWLARAARSTGAGQTAQAADHRDRALSLLAEAPDDLLELSALRERLAACLDGLDSELSLSEPDVTVVGALVSDVSRDLDRAAVLDSLHGPPGAREDLDRLQERFAAMDNRDAESGLTALAERMRNLERLTEITKRLSAERDTQKLLDLIIDAAIELTGAARGFLILFDGRAEEFRAARNIDERTIAHPEFQISHSVARQVVRDGVPLLTANAVDDARLLDASSISELKLLSILCVPIAWRGRVQGAVYLDHPRVVARFRESHLETVSRLAEQAAIALENARLSHGLEQSNTELEARRAEVAKLNEALQQRLMLREAELEQTRLSLDASRRALALRYDYSAIVTRSPRMHAVLDLLDRVTDTHFPVMILGESGTGKELLARAVHFNGPRKAQNFLSINCAAFAEPLIESELFGSMRGAFTGADRDRKGLFAQAHNGTLFLDEIGDMSLDVQKRLLRVLQEGEFLPVGGREVVKVDVRILCATHRQLEVRVAEGSFREDLYYRLAVARVELPPLRERPEDLALLIPHFIERHGGRLRSLDPEALAQLEARPWPGNVRELENFVMNLLLFDREGERLSSELVRRLLGEAASGDGAASGAPAGGGSSLKARVEAYERAQILGALSAHEGNKAAAARALGVPVRSLYKMLERLDIRDA